MDEIWVYPIILILLTFSILAMRILLPRLIKKLKEKGKIGIDVHKVDKPEVAEMGGISILIVASVASLIAIILLMFLDAPIIIIQLIVFISVIGLAGLIGFIDDIYKLGSKIKPVLVAGTSFPLLIANFIYLNQVFNTDPYIPLVQGFDVTYYYWILIPVAITIAANAVNMMDVVNGSMSGPCIIIFSTLLICSFIQQPISVIGALLSSIMLGCMIIFYKYNRFPAKVFAGDVGALTIGAALALTGIMGQMEIVTIVVAMPMVINAFQMLTSVGGFVEGRKIKERPSIVQSDGTIAASTNSKAPLTLMRITMAKSPLKEPEIARQFMVLTLFCAFLAIITAFLTYHVKLF
ncbi:MAG: hypothetical protein HWN65_13535 [Candidatus Helarchaeota archaeon]|nr:hypothetical protein [Candidatus Helarchaeota archaeon]